MPDRRLATLHIPESVSPEEASGILCGVEEALRKAVAAHPSHVQARDKGGRFTRWSWRRQHAARDASGRFVTRLTAAERRAAGAIATTAAGVLKQQLGWHLTDAADGRLSPEAAAERAKVTIAHAYELIYRAGLQTAGNPGILLTPQDRAIIGRLARDEADYFARFLREAAAGTSRIPLPERLDMYRRASLQMRWMGFAMGNAAPSRRLWWDLGPTDHCETCMDMADRSPWTVGDFIREAIAKGYVPQGGDLACKGLRCQCALRETF